MNELIDFLVPDDDEHVSVTVPPIVMTITECAFSCSINIVSLTLPVTITTIDECAFYGYGSICSITLAYNFGAVEQLQTALEGKKDGLSIDFEPRHSRFFIVWVICSRCHHVQLIKMKTLRPALQLIIMYASEVRDGDAVVSGIADEKPVEYSEEDEW